MSEILVERHGPWAEIIFNRPERRNAINHGFGLQLRDALRDLNADDNVGVVLLQGAGGAFCSGLDLKEFNVSPPPPWHAEFSQAWVDVHHLLLESNNVLVTALQGGAINGGAAVALAGDLMVAGRTAFVQVGEAQFGMPMPRNASWLVLRHGEAVAMRFALMAERVLGEDLFRLGVATEVVDDDQVLQRARALATRISGFPLAGLRAAKAAIRQTSVRAGALDWFKPALDASPLKPFVPTRVS